MKTYHLLLSLALLSLPGSTYADPAADTALDQAVNDFRTWFNIDVAKQDLKSTAIRMEHGYYTAFKTCTPGAYRYVIYNPRYALDHSPAIELATAQITGLEKDKCVVLLEPNTANNTECKFSQKSITALIKMDDANIDSAVTPAIAAGALKALDDCTS